MTITNADRRRMAKALKKARASPRAKLEREIDLYTQKFKARNEGIQSGMLRARLLVENLAGEAFKAHLDSIALERRNLAQLIGKEAAKVYDDGERILGEAIRDMRKRGRVTPP